MGFFDFAFRTNRLLADNELPNIFPLPLLKEVFIRSDIEHTYIKILTDVIDRTHGIPESVKPSLWDNCLQNEASLGLVTLLAKAMTKKQDLYLVFKDDVLRKATQAEEQQIREDYKKLGESKVGVYVSFKNYRRTEMLEIYSALEYCILGSLNKTVNISNALQVKVSELRASVSLQDENVASEQARSIARALERGSGVMLDKNDEIALANPDTTATEKSIQFLDAKRAFILDMPLAYIVGEQTSGMNANGQADAKAVERGLRQYFVSIIRPVVKALYGVEVEFKTQDFSQVLMALEVLKTFELVSDSYLSAETKREITARVLDIDAEEEEKRLEAEENAREDVTALPIPQISNTEEPTNTENGNK